MRFSESRNLPTSDTGQEILLTVPHARCLVANDPQHLCDTRARALQRALEEELERLRVRTRVIVGDTNRQQCDLNRDALCNQSSHFRTQLKQALRDERLRLVLDCHSFPAQLSTRCRTLSDRLREKGCQWKAE